MNDLIINVAAGLITSVLAPFIVLRRGGGSPPPPDRQSLYVHGDNNAVNQIDASVHEYRIYESVPTPAHRNSPSSGSDAGDDPWVVIVGMLLAAGLLALGYMMVWPVIVWAFTGAAIGISLATTWMHLTTRDTPGPRTTAFVLTLISSGLLVVLGREVGDTPVGSLT